MKIQKCILNCTNISQYYVYQINEMSFKNILKNQIDPKLLNSITKYLHEVGSLKISTMYSVSDRIFFFFFFFLHTTLNPSDLISSLQGKHFP